jgi:RHS repeat-associated protein
MKKEFVTLGYKPTVFAKTKTVFLLRKMRYLKYKMYLSNFHFYNTKNYLYSKPVKGLKGYGKDYRFSFNGHEKDDEVVGSGNHLSFGDYGYDPRLARRWNNDPLSAQFPWQSPYVVFNNNPIYFSDPTGLSPDPPPDQQVIKTANNSYMNIPSGATVETFGTKKITTTGGVDVAVDAGAARAFTVDGNRYVAGFNNEGGFTGYVLSTDLKTQYSPMALIYESKITASFKNKLLEISYNLGHDPNKLLAVFAQETGETFSPSIRSEDGQVGLLQFTGAAITQINSKFGTH